MSAPVAGTPGQDQYTEIEAERVDGDGLFVLTDRELLATMQTELDSALGWAGTRLSEARRQNLNEYFGNQRGDEVEGRSQVVSRSTFEQVEWFLPPIMEMFTAGPEVVNYVPNNEKETEEADQRSAAGNYVWKREGGFMFLLTALKDAAIEKNGIGKVWYDTNPAEGVIEQYEGKSFEELNAILADPNTEIRATTAWRPLEEGKPYDQGQEVSLDGINPEELPSLYFDVTAVRKNNTGRVRLENIPPEDFWINRDARSLDHETCRALGERRQVSGSDLVRLGLDPELVARIPTANSVGATTDQNRIVRSSQDDGNPFAFGTRTDSERQLYVIEGYLLVDRDGDGISEWWRVIAGGEYGQLFLHAEPCDGHPYVSYTPIPIPHRFYGLAIADVTSDIQNRETSLERQYFDSLYLATDPRNVVFSQGVGDAATPMVNLDQLMQAVPGGYIEEYERGALRPYEQKNNAAEILPGFEYLDGIKNRRTGISPESMGVDASAISKHVYGAMVQQTGAQRRIVLMARIAAEQFVTRAFKLIDRCLRRHHSQEMMIQLRGKWIATSPAEWGSDMDCEIAVGLGHGSRMERAADAEAIAEVQARLLEGGFARLVSEENLYASALNIAEARGQKDAARFFQDPSQLPPPEPEPDVAQEALQIQAQVEFGKLELERQSKENERFELMHKMKIAEWEHEEAIWKLRIEAAAKGVTTTIPLDDPGLSYTPNQGPDMTRVQPAPPPPGPGEGGTQ